VLAGKSLDEAYAEAQRRDVRANVDATTLVPV
jgi:hypothetical protein